MIAENTVRATLTALPERGGGGADDTVELHFNPETLTFRWGTTTASSTARGRGQTEASGRTTCSLSFDCTFDLTRPPTTTSTASRSPGSGPGASLSLDIGASASGTLSASAGAGIDADGIVSVTAGASASFSAGFEASASFGASESPPPSGGGGASQDVRQITGRIAGWLTGTGTTSHPRPKRVRFHWGNIVYEGVIETFSETIDFFAADGTALRSKASIAIKEASQTNDVSASDRESAALQGGFDAAASLSLDFSASAGFGLNASVGFGAGIDLSVSAQAGVSMSADLALGVFGGAAAGAALGGGVDASSTPTARSSAAQPAAPATPTSWAPAGPPANTAASQSATIVAATRAAGGAAALPAAAEGSFTATRLGGSTSEVAPAPATSSERAVVTTVPLPVKGSPPRRYAVAERPVARGHAVPVEQPYSRIRPRWQTLRPAATPEDAASSPCDCDGRPRCR